MTTVTVLLSFFYRAIVTAMANDSLISEVERVVRQRYALKESGQLKREEEAARHRAAVPSTAQRQTKETRVDQLLLPDEKRAKMPLTKEEYLVRENPQLVMWERETRKFLRQLSPQHEHRVSASMIYEWATGLSIADLMAAEKAHREQRIPQENAPTWRADTRKINKVLTFYFGSSYMTWIAGRKVAKAYKVRKGYLIFRHRPMTLTLWVDWKQGVKL